MKKGMLFLVLIIVFLLGFLSNSLLSAQANEDIAKAPKRYYTSVQLEHGDNLWNIAHRYASSSGMSIGDYVEELKRMNHLENTDVYAGQYLMIVYGEEA